MVTDMHVELVSQRNGNSLFFDTELMSQRNRNGLFFKINIFVNECLNSVLKSRTDSMDFILYLTEVWTTASHVTH